MQRELEALRKALEDNGLLLVDMAIITYDKDKKLLSVNGVGLPALEGNPNINEGVKAYFDSVAKEVMGE